jgi:hypothetical protein
MIRSLAAANLRSADLEPAFALVQALYPTLSMASWQAFAAPLADQHPLALRGLIGIRNEAAYLCGLFAYRTESDLQQDRAFIVDVIAALDTLDAKAVLRAMVEAMQSTAQRLGCRIVRIRVTHGQDGLALYLGSYGLAHDGHFMSLPVAQPLHET